MKAAIICVVAYTALGLCFYVLNNRLNDRFGTERCLVGHNETQQKCIDDNAFYYCREYTLREMYVCDKSAP